MSFARSTGALCPGLSLEPRPVYSLSGIGSGPHARPCRATPLPSCLRRQTSRRARRTGACADCPPGPRGSPHGSLRRAAARVPLSSAHARCRVPRPAAGGRSRTTHRRPPAPFPPRTQARGRRNRRRPLHRRSRACASSSSRSPRATAPSRVPCALVRGAVQALAGEDVRVRDARIANARRQSRARRGARHPEPCAPLRL